MSYLDISDLVVRHGHLEVLHGVSLRLERGETVAVVGRNGAGKTTLLQAIFGFIRASEGAIRFDRTDLLRHAPHQMVRLGISYVPEDRGIFRELTVLENLRLGAFRSQSEEAEQLQDVFALFPLLEERAKSPVAALSGGQQQMVALGRALMSRPSLLLLDEPSLGLAPKMIDALYGTLLQLARRGMTVLLVEQNVRRALSIASRGYLLNLGRVVMEASAAKILADERLQDIYLGKSAELLHTEDQH